MCYSIPRRPRQDIPTVYNVRINHCYTSFYVLVNSCNPPPLWRGRSRLNALFYVAGTTGRDTVWINSDVSKPSGHISSLRIVMQSYSPVWIIVCAWNNALVYVFHLILYCRPSLFRSSKTINLNSVFIIRAPSIIRRRCRRPGCQAFRAIRHFVQSSKCVRGFRWVLL